MSATPREIVYRTLAFDNPPRAPRDIWPLPIALEKYPREYEAILRDYPMDLQRIYGHYRERVPTHGDPYAVGEYRDEWGCVFVNIQRGIIGEVKDPPVKDWESDLARVHIPRERLTVNRDAVNRDCEATDRFTLMGENPRPFEQLQFIRGTPDLMMDLLDPPPAMRRFVQQMHEFYCAELQAWAETDVDGLTFLDDWGSQRSLLIAPSLWREIFKPMYRDFVQIAHGAGKKIFMHSDGYILDIYPDLVELGVDAINSQIFCMGVERLAPWAGKITFWGEIDRQYLLCRGTRDEIAAAVRSVHRHLWRNGGCFAQTEFGGAVKPENVRQVFATWDELTNANAA
ncbi:MAG: uroporphyrinogen decarboxylase family protein [Verrucomicrobiae bacterium]|nr:uroporphyrinogen decarboxylase family protein [Verrucomicrobiae bacterium]